MNSIKSISIGIGVLLLFISYVYFMKKLFDLLKPWFFKNKLALVGMFIATMSVLILLMFNASENLLNSFSSIVILVIMVFLMFLIYFVVSYRKEKVLVGEFKTEKKDRLNREFEILIECLKKTHLFNHESRRFNLELYKKVTVLQSYQYLLVVFRNIMNPRLESIVDNTDIYSLFNDYFKVEMTTQNWNRFTYRKKESILHERLENDFYIDLFKEIKKVGL
jgi:hypothetical protein